MSVHRNLFVLAVLGASTLSVMAQNQSGAVSRDQVSAEAAAAVAAGRIPSGEQPFGDPPLQRGVSTASRSEVNAQAVDAVVAGRIGRGELGYELPAFEPTKTRAEVGAETRIAMRLGLLPRGEAQGRAATASEAELIRVAGQRAREAAPSLASR